MFGFGLNNENLKNSMEEKLQHIYLYYTYLDILQDEKSYIWSIITRTSLRNQATIESKNKIKDQLDILSDINAKNQPKGQLKDQFNTDSEYISHHTINYIKAKLDTNVKHIHKNILEVDRQAGQEACKLLDLLNIIFNIQNS